MADSVHIAGEAAEARDHPATGAPEKVVVADPPPEPDYPRFLVERPRR